MLPSPSTRPFVRTRLTWMSYLSIGYYSYLLNTLGPLTPFLRSQMNLSYTIASLHFSAYAVGMILTGSLLDRAARRFGVRGLVWGGAAGMACGALLLMLGRHPLVTILGALLMGLTGVCIAALLSPALIAHHGEHSTIALAESSVSASLLAALAPVAVGFFARTALTWRAALGLMILALPLLWLAYRRVPVPGMDSQPSAENGKKPGPLPFGYWLFWGAVLLAVAVEFCINFWAADYLEKVSGLARADAALGVTAFLGAELLGRATLSRLLRSIPVPALLSGSLVTAAAGFLIFWIFPVPPAALLGLVLAGWGISGLFPILNAQALAVIPDRMVEGSGRISLSMGVAILLLPLLLGRLADWTGIHAAYGLVAVLLVLTFAVMRWGQSYHRPEPLTAASSLPEDDQS